MANNVLQKVLVSVMLLVMIGASVLTSSAFVVNKQQSMNRVVSHGEQITAIGAWWNNDWYYRKPLTIDHTKVVDDLKIFPFLFTINHRI